MGRRHLQFAALIATLVGFIVGFNATTADDSFITLRYAANLVHGHGPVFNLGERVEGYTSPVHLLVSALVYLLPGGYVLLKLKLASLLAALAGVAVGTALIDRLIPHRGLRVVAAVLLGLSFPVAAASTNALETGIAFVLTTTLLYGAVRRWPTEAPARFGAVAAAMMLTRPDAMLLVGAVFVLLLVSEGSARARVVRAALVAGLPLVVYEVFRVVYFGDVLPNTYYAKSYPIDEGAGFGLTTVGRYFTGPVPAHASTLTRVAAIGVLGLVAVLVGLGAYRLRRTPVVALVVACQFVSVVSVGGDWMAGRFAAPVWTGVVVLLVAGVALIVETLSPRFPERVVLVMGVVALTGIIAMPWLEQRRPLWRTKGVDDPGLLASSDHYLRTVWAEGAEELLSCARAGDLVVYSEIGYAGFQRMDLEFLDPRGLTDRAIAKHAVDELHSVIGVLDRDWADPASVVGREILRRRPSIIVNPDGGPVDTPLKGSYVPVTIKRVGRVAMPIYRRADVDCRLTASGS